MPRPRWPAVIAHGGRAGMPRPYRIGSARIYRAWTLLRQLAGGVAEEGDGLGDILDELGVGALVFDGELDAGFALLLELLEDGLDLADAGAPGDVVGVFLAELVEVLDVHAEDLALE